MTATIRKSIWNTYAITGYTHQVGTDAAATGGVHRHEVRKTKAGWQKRVVDSNGRFQSAGPVTPVTEADGEAMFAQAEKR